MQQSPRAMVVPFLLAVPIGFALGRVRDKQGPIPVEPTSELQHGTGNRTRQAPPDLDQLLSGYQEQEVEGDQGRDPIIELLSEWSEVDLEKALAEAMRSPQCLARLGEGNSLPWRLFAAWIKKNPDTAAAWIDTIKSAEMRELFLREACRGWPADRAMEGVDYLLAHHWRSGPTYPSELLTAAVESQAKAGVAEVESLLQRLLEAGIDVRAESLSFPPDFDYSSLVSSPVFLAQQEPQFQDVVFAEWRDSQPDRLINWMEKTGEWQHFKAFLDSDEQLHAATFWDGANPDTRQAVIAKMKWSQFTPERIKSLVRDTTDPAGQDLLISRCIQTSYGTGRWAETVSTLEMIPSAERRVGILQQLHPKTDWRPGAALVSGDPPNATIAREAIAGWGITVDPPAAPEAGEPDPFAPNP